jgi:hypothetical protein
VLRVPILERTTPPPPAAEPEPVSEPVVPPSPAAEPEPVVVLFREVPSESELFIPAPARPRSRPVTRRTAYSVA